MDKCRGCNMNFEGLCDYYDEMPIKNAIMVCETDEFLQYPSETNEEDE